MTGVLTCAQRFSKAQCDDVCVSDQLAPSSGELWAQYDGVTRVVLTIVLALITLALIGSLRQMQSPIRPPR